MTLVSALSRESAGGWWAGCAALVGLSRRTVRAEKSPAMEYARLVEGMVVGGAAKALGGRNVWKLSRGGSGQVTPFRWRPPVGCSYGSSVGRCGLQKRDSGAWGTGGG